MKKSKTKGIKLWRKSRASLVGGLVAVALIAAAGVYTIISSSAATGTITFIMVDANDGSYVPANYGYVSMAIVNPGTPLCSNMDGLTDASGRVVLNNCATGVPYQITFINFKNGWYTVSPSSGINTGTQIGIGSGNGTFTGFIRVVATDTDKDGVPDKSDSCISSAGPASNKGCPVPAAPAPTPTPSAPAPTTPTVPAPTKTPTSSSSTSSKKTVTTTAPQTKTPAVVAGTTGDTSPPVAPTNVIASQLDDGVFLSWDESTDNAGVTGYNVYRSTDNKTWSRIADSIKTTYYTDSDASIGTHYYYKIDAKDAAGNISEGVIEDIELVSSKSSDKNSSTNKPKSASPASKNSGSVVAGLSIAVLVVLGLIIGTFVFLRRRLQANSDPYSYDVSNISVPSIPPAQVMQDNPSLTGQPPLPPQPSYNPGPPAEHTSMSLKDMVLEDMNREHHNIPPTPPTPPAPHQ